MSINVSSRNVKMYIYRNPSGVSDIHVHLILLIQSREHGSIIKINFQLYCLITPP